MERSNQLLVVLVAGLVVGSGVTAVVGELGDLGLGTPGEAEATPTPTAPAPPEDAPVDTFANQSAYVDYVRRGQRRDYVRFDGPRRVVSAGPAPETATAVADAGRPTPMPTRTSVATEGGGGEESGERRVGQTNVQVAGIDEPSLVTAFSRHFYYAPRGRAPRYYEPTPVPVTRAEPTKQRPERPEAKTHVLNTTDAGHPALAASLDVSGKMLRAGDHLVVVGSERIYGYDVADRENPERIWTRPLNATFVTGRMRGGTLYLVTRSPASPDEPCPIEPIGEDAAVPCDAIHRPDEQIRVDATYAAIAVHPGNGSVASVTGFVGTRSGTAVYMSGSSLYLTYTSHTPRSELQADYLLNESDVVPARVTDRIREIRSYDLSPRARQIEIDRTIERWLDGKSPERRRDLRETLAEGLADYAAARQRSLTTTGIVRIGVGDGLAVTGVGQVPGRPLNQFSLNQGDGELRIATTVPRAGDAESKNDLYTLDVQTMSVTGSVRNMSPGQRIYSVRYVGDNAYLVTFRQVDPLHVVDLSGPGSPRELGQVKLPGFSDYLHPIGEDRLLGVGEADGEVKVTLFDVSDPANPKVLDEKRLDADWSRVSETHHAFMQDRRHGVVFLPAGDDGIVLNYENDTLGVETRIAMDGPAKRARYVGDHLYVFGREEVTVLNETTWERTETVDLP